MWPLLFQLHLVLILFSNKGLSPWFYDNYLGVAKSVSIFTTQIHAICPVLNYCILVIGSELVMKGILFTKIPHFSVSEIDWLFYTTWMCKYWQTHTDFRVFEHAFNNFKHILQTSLCTFWSSSVWAWINWSLMLRFQQHKKVVKCHMSLGRYLLLQGLKHYFFPEYHKCFLREIRVHFDRMRALILTHNNYDILSRQPKVPKTTLDNLYKCLISFKTYIIIILSLILLNVSKNNSLNDPCFPE